MGTGKITIFTGSGRGKTAAALGMALQRATRGEKIVIIQFLKGRSLMDSAFLRKLEPEIKLFRFEKSAVTFDEMSEEQRLEESERYRNGLNYAKKVLATGECDCLIMDEVLGLLSNNIASVEDIKGVLKNRIDTDVILTGNGSNDDVFGFADEISEISTVYFKNYD